MFCILAKDRIKAAQERQYEVYTEIDKRYQLGWERLDIHFHYSYQKGAGACSKQARPRHATALDLGALLVGILKHVTLLIF